MGRRELQQQKALVDHALAMGTDEELRRVLQGTIGDAQSFCWAALRQFERRRLNGTSSKDFGLYHADLHLLLVISHEAVCHVEVVENLLGILDTPETLPPDPTLRKQLREARNLLAEHRDERVLYWRLTSRHTPHVIERYQCLGLAVPQGPIDSEVIGYSAPPGATADEIEVGEATIGTVGGLLSLPELHLALVGLESCLDELALHHRD